jgi:hypothetical protein
MGADGTLGIHATEVIDTLAKIIVVLTIILILVQHASYGICTMVVGYRLIDHNPFGGGRARNSGRFGRKIKNSGRRRYFYPFL